MDKAISIPKTCYNYGIAHNLEIQIQKCMVGLYKTISFLAKILWFRLSQMVFFYRVKNLGAYNYYIESFHNTQKTDEMNSLVGIILTHKLQ